MTLSKSESKGGVMVCVSGAICAVVGPTKETERGGGQFNRCGGKRVFKDLQ